MFFRRRSDFLLVYTTFPTEESAAHVASEVIGKKLAACANIIPKVRSLYWWDGVVQDNPEVVMILKTTRDKWKALEADIKMQHPYEVAGITAVEIAAGSPEYLDWIRKETALSR